jgi:outer membrane murein-binding lipoprotein Lpp
LHRLIVVALLTRSTVAISQEIEMGLMLIFLVVLLLVGGLTAAVLSVVASKSKKSVNSDEVADLREKIATLSEQVDRLRDDVAHMKKQGGDSGS